MAKTAAFLAISGEVQVQDGVTHLIAERMWAPALERVPATRGSRDFR